jgi:hypothetical protein
VVSARVAFALPSSHTLSTPAANGGAGAVPGVPSVRPVGGLVLCRSRPVRPDQNAAVFDLWVLTASPWTTGRLRVTSAPGRAAPGFGAGVPCVALGFGVAAPVGLRVGESFLWVRIRGSSLVDPSSYPWAINWVTSKSRLSSRPAAT